MSDINRGFFITGTDTDSGKSFFGSGLVRFFYQKGLPVQPRKPLESGCKTIKDKLIPSDGSAYYEAVGKSISLDTITPYRYSEALAPPQLMTAQKHITIAQAQTAILAHTQADSIIIAEGAGGFYSPICYDGLNADLAKALALPVILVVNNRVGCINHALLSIEAIKKQSLNIAAIVLNDLHNQTSLLEKNLASLNLYCSQYSPTLSEHIYTLPYKSHDFDQFTQLESFL